MATRPASAYSVRCTIPRDFNTALLRDGVRGGVVHLQVLHDDAGVRCRAQGIAARGTEPWAAISAGGGIDGGMGPQVTRRKAGDGRGANLVTGAARSW